jgi:hypothetical protein
MSAIPGTETLPLKDLFLQWLFAMHMQEKELSVARGNHTKLWSVYKKAHDELKKYPLPIKHPRDCQVVKGIGPAIVKLLETKLHDHVRSHVDTQIESGVGNNFGGLGIAGGGGGTAGGCLSRLGSSSSSSSSSTTVKGKAGEQTALDRAQPIRKIMPLYPMLSQSIRAELSIL